MLQKDYTTKKREFKHLTKEKRAQIEILLKSNMPKTQIAKTLRISRSTLYRELERGTVVQKDTNLKEYKAYFYDVGQRVYEENRANSKNSFKFAKVYDFIKYAEKEILEKKLSPDAICGRVKLMKIFKNTVCTKTLYNYIDKGLLKVKNIDLPLRVKRKRKRDVVKKNRRILGLSIENRPEIVETREEFGHWEIDTVVGKREYSPVLLTLDERKTRKRHIVKINSRSSKSVEEGLKKIIAIYGDNFNSIFKSITSDNGSEFSTLKDVIPDVPVYYAHPYSSFERGTNEKQNSLIRKFLPKGKSFDNVSDEVVTQIEDWINNLPRKIFGYHSSLEMFNSVLFDIAI